MGFQKPCTWEIFGVNKVILHFLFDYQSCVYIIPVGTQREKQGVVE